MDYVISLGMVLETHQWNPKVQLDSFTGKSSHVVFI